MKVSSSSLLFSIVLAGCGGSSATTPDAAVDANLSPDTSPSADAPAADVGTPADVPVSTDAGPRDAGAPVDVPAADVVDAATAADASPADAALVDASTPVDAPSADAATPADAPSADVPSVDASAADVTTSPVDAATDVPAADVPAVDVPPVDVPPPCLAPNLTCDGACVDPATDVRHCGGCGNACPTGGTCTAGTCACAAWETVCSGRCADTAHDRLHCGACGAACATGTACFGSTCGAIEAVDALANGVTYGPSMSDDQRYVALYSRATNFLTGDTNGRYDVYVRDRVLGTWQRVSLATDGSTEGDGDSQNPDISGNGRVVAFVSSSTNLVAGDVNGNNDVFAYDLASRALVHVSAGLAATEFADNARVTADGRLVAFRTNGAVFLHGGTARQAVLYDRTARTYELISQTSTGGPGNGESAFPSMSTDGRYIAFESGASNLVTGDTNGFYDVLVRDRTAGTTERVSVATDGTQANNSSRRPMISRDGRYVAFQSDATNLVAGDTNGRSDVYVHDRTTHTTTRVSLRADGVEPNGVSMPTGVSTTGRVLFYSEATNLVTGDPGSGRDLLTFDLATRALFTVSSRLDGTVSGGFADASAISPDGTYVVFQSNAGGDLVTGVSGAHVYLRYVAP